LKVCVANPVMKKKVCLKITAKKVNGAFLFNGRPHRG
jgi:hypothetical protein